MNNKEYTHNGVKYSMTSHGFARDMVFEMISKSDNEIWYQLNDNDVTKKNYPFGFRLEIGYKLAENKIIIMWRVKNTDNEELYFSIGAHPAFNCPLNMEGDKNDYYICFHDVESLSLSLIDVNSGLLRDDKKEIMMLSHVFADGSKAGLIKITNNLFSNDALIAENYQIKKISLLKPDKTPYVTVEFDTPLFGVWSKIDGSAPFVCIEPWYGRCDRIGFDKSLSEREYVYNLKTREEFYSEYSITVI